MKKFGLYYHKETCKTDVPIESLEWIGQSLPFYNEVRQRVSERLESNIPLHKVDIKAMYTVHTKEYLNSVIDKIKGLDVEIKTSMECHNLWHMIEGYEYSLGGVYKAIEMMRNGDLDRAYCFSMPSHHAYSDHSHGYCLLNIQAAGIRYAQELGFKKILIIDWDHHHGDGTQSIFENDENVKQISIHSGIDLYMGMCDVIKYGTTTHGEQVGHINIPVLTDLWIKEDYNRELEIEGDVFEKENAIDVFKQSLDSGFVPDMIMIFDGHDASELDCGKEAACWSDEDFSNLTKAVIDKSIEWDCPILSMPGGGYVEHTIDLSIQHATLLSEYRI